MKIEKYIITNIHRGKRERNHVLYGELRDENNKLLIGATIDYILDQLREMTREYKWTRRKSGQGYYLAKVAKE
jgi:hypothetical protein